MIGEIFGRLTVINYSHQDKHYLKYWECQCNCKNKTMITVRQNALTSGRTKSCGCLKQELNKQRRKNNTYEQKDGIMIGYTEEGEEFYLDIEDYETIQN